MKATSGCLKCGVEQAFNLLKRVSKDEEFLWNGLKKVMESLARAPYGLTPAQLAEYFYPELSRFIGVKDPFEMEKKLYNDRALAIYDDLRRKVESMEDPLKMAGKLAIVGNSIDFGVPSFEGMDLENEILKEAMKELMIDDFDDFMDELKRARRLIYVLDNCGEVVFDKLFMELIKKKFPNLEMISAVRSAPIINDVTMKEALEIGLDEVSKVVNSGVELPGLVLKRVNEDFRRIWRSSDLIISKGQGNFEGLEGLDDRRIFFFLKAKCDVVANYLGVPKGSLVLMRNVGHAKGDER